MPPVLRERDFRLLFGATAVSLFGDGFVKLALAFAVLEAGGGAAEIGLVLAARMGANVATLLAGGVIADRIGPRKVMIAADVARVLSQGAIAALLLADAASVGALAALSAATGAATGCFNPASTGLMQAIVKPERVQEAISLRGMAQAVGETVGPAVGGVLVATVGAGTAMAIDAATYAVSAGFLTAIRHVPAMAEPQHFITELKEGWREFTSRRWVWSFVAIAALTNLSWPAWTVLGPVIAEQDLGGADTWGFILAVWGAGLLLGGLIALRIEPRRPILVATVTGPILALPALALATSTSVAVIAAGTLIAGIALMHGNTLWEATLQRHIPPATMGRVSAYDWLGSIVTYPIGAALWGPVAESIGIHEALGVAAVSLAVLTLLPLLVREVRTLPAYPTQ